jgi:acetylornithine deacetylase/succinyl-diaminopimelate desuccinylase-like protein
MRLVPDQTPATVAERFTRFVQDVKPKGVTVEVSYLHGAEAVLIDTSGPLVDAAMQALADVWGKRPVRVREGGSIPIVSTFGRVLKVPVALVGFGLSDDNLHSPNEKFNLSHFYNGIRTVARLLDLAAEV